MQIFVNTNYDFIKWRFVGVIFSLLVIAAGAVGFAMKGINIGIDFSGGANVVLRFQGDPPITELRKLAPDATIQQYGKAVDQSVLIRLPKLERETDYAGQVVRKLNADINKNTSGKVDLNFHGAGVIAEMISQTDPDAKGKGADAKEYYLGVARNIIANRSGLGIFHSMDEVKGSEGLTPAAFNVVTQNSFLGQFNVLNQETVGPQVGHDLQRKAMWAILASIFAIGAYIAVRFDFKFGVAAMVCLAHDVAVALAFLILKGGEFSLGSVASFLMIVGYSINDTVVVYDRVRENARKGRTKEPFESMFNRSLNQTLSRTILTSLFVLIILVSLIIFGGVVINDFAWLLLVGTICGTYSTITIVPAFVLAWNKFVARKGDMYGGPAR